jgi:hypothetical protein
MRRDAMDGEERRGALLEEERWVDTFFWGGLRVKEEMRDLYRPVCSAVGRRRILLCATDARAAVANGRIHAMREALRMVIGWGIRAWMGGKVGEASVLKN